MNTADSELIKQAQAGDDAAFSVLVELYAASVFRLAWRFCDNRHDAEDLSQEVWIKAHKSIKTFRFESAFYTWLRQILIRTFLNRRSKIETVQLDEEFAFSDSCGQDYERKMMADRVRESLRELTAHQRLIFLLKHDEGMTYDEIASALDCSSGAIKKSLFRAVNKLREKFGVNSASKI